MSWINNAKDVPLNANSGTVPDMSGTLQDWYQKMTFGVITKTVTDFQVVESVVEIQFMGVWQALDNRKLMLKPEGQRAWSWYTLHSQPTINLKVDDIIIYLTRQYRVMSKKNFSLYKFQRYELIGDWEESGPPTP